MASAGAEFAEGFRLLFPLAERRAGSVWRAERSAGGEQLVVAIVPSERGATRVVRFVREMERVATVEHASVVRVLSQGTTADGDGFAMLEALTGRSLADRLAEAPAMPLSELVAIADRLLDGLAKLHAAGVVHGDIEASNVFLCDESGPVAVPKLIGLGLSRADERTATDVDPADEGSLRSLGYMSPEQARGEHGGARSDLYSLGVVLYEAACGRLPFGGVDARALRAAIDVGVHMRLDRVRTDLPRWFVELVEKAMGREPTSRFANADSMRRALTASSASALRAKPISLPVGPRGRVPETQPSPSGAAATPVRVARPSAPPPAFAAGYVGVPRPGRPNVGATRPAPPASPPRRGRPAITRAPAPEPETQTTTEKVVPTAEASPREDAPTPIEPTTMDDPVATKETTGTIAEAKSDPTTTAFTEEKTQISPPTTGDETKLFDDKTEIATTTTATQEQKPEATKHEPDAATSATVGEKRETRKNEAAATSRAQGKAGEEERAEEAPIAIGVPVTDDESSATQLAPRDSFEPIDAAEAVELRPAAPAPPAIPKRTPPLPERPTHGRAKASDAPLVEPSRDERASPLPPAPLDAVVARAPADSPSSWRTIGIAVAAIAVVTLLATAAVVATNRSPTTPATSGSERATPASAPTESSGQTVPTTEPPSVPSLPPTDTTERAIEPTAEPPPTALPPTPTAPETPEPPTRPTPAIVAPTPVPPPPRPARTERTERVLRAERTARPDRPRTSERAPVERTSARRPGRTKLVRDPGF